MLPPRNTSREFGLNFYNLPAPLLARKFPPAPTDLTHNQLLTSTDKNRKATQPRLQRKSVRIMLAKEHTRYHLREQSSFSDLLAHGRVRPPNVQNDSWARCLEESKPTRYQRELCPRTPSGPHRGMPTAPQKTTCTTTAQGNRTQGGCRERWPGRNWSGGVFLGSDLVNEASDLSRRQKYTAYVGTRCCEQNVCRLFTHGDDTHMKPALPKLRRTIRKLTKNMPASSIPNLFGAA